MTTDEKRDAVCVEPRKYQTKPIPTDVWELPVPEDGKELMEMEAFKDAPIWVRLAIKDGDLELVRYKDAYVDKTLGFGALVRPGDYIIRHGEHGSPMCSRRDIFHDLHELIPEVE